MRVMICGGPRYTDRKLIFSSLDRTHAKRGVDLVIHGQTTIPDLLACEWALLNGIPHTGLPGFPDYGRFQPFERLVAMIRISLPDGIIAFPGTSGLENLVCRVRGMELPIWEPASGTNRTIAGPKTKPVEAGVGIGPLKREWYRGAVYVIGTLTPTWQIRSPVKVGRVAALSTVEARLRTLQTASPRQLAVAHIEGADISSSLMERTAHLLLARYRMSGEWFDCPVETAIEAVQKAKRQELSPDMWPNYPRIIERGPQQTDDANPET